MSSSKTIPIFPVVTEKSSTLQGTSNQYAFFVPLEANKVEIEKAVEALKPGITVEEVRTLIVRGKVKRLGRFTGQRPNRKKALVRLSAGQTLEHFESA